MGTGDLFLVCHKKRVELFVKIIFEISRASKNHLNTLDTYTTTSTAADLESSSSFQSWWVQRDKSISSFSSSLTTTHNTHKPTTNVIVVVLLLLLGAVTRIHRINNSPYVSFYEWLSFCF